MSPSECEWTMQKGRTHGSDTGVCSGYVDSRIREVTDKE